MFAMSVGTSSRGSTCTGVKRRSILVLASLLTGCSLGPTIVGTYDSGSGSGTDGQGAEGDGAPTDGEAESEGGDESSTGEPISCPGVEPSVCSYCAPDLDGVACSEDGDLCSNGVDVACACQGGRWTCSDEPLVDACGPACIEAGPCEKRGCLDQLVVDFDLPPLQGDFGTVQTGIYSVNVVADGESRSCEFEIQYNAIDLAYLFVHRGCDVEGDGFDADAPDLRLRARPNTVYAEVVFEGNVLAQGEVADIEYAFIEANGPGCDGVCLQAEVQIPGV